MAYVAPFRGLRYNPEKVSDLSKVVTPPYDVISPAEQKRFHHASAYNMVRLELGERTPNDNVSYNAHTRAADYLRKWQQEAVLVRDTIPSIYYYELDYPLTPEQRQKRYGFICLLRLEEFRAGSVRPHERTFQAVKDERLNLMLATDANLSPVFALFSDPEYTLDEHLRVKNDNAIIHLRDENGLEHTLWKVQDGATIGTIRGFLQDKPIFIADGHHRYETALAYRSRQRECHPNLGADSPFEYIMVYLANMNQEGLAILPTHRLIRHLDGWDPGSFLHAAEEFFEISSFDNSEGGELSWRQDLVAARQNHENVIGMYYRKAERFYLLKARNEATSAFLSEQRIPPVLQGLDVVVLDQLILKNLMELSEQFLADDQNIHFKHDISDALMEVRSGRYDAGFFINPTRIEQVQEVAGAGLIMPHKSTYFFPKVMSGLVIHHPLVSDEQVV